MKPFESLTEQGKARRHRSTAELALVQYGIEPTELRQLAIDTNFVFGVRSADGSRYALRIHRQGTDGRDIHRLADTELECWWVQKLAENGLPVAAVIDNGAGDPITVVDQVPGVPGPQRCVLFQWLPGGEPDEDALWFWTELGRLAARLHQHSAGLELPTGAKPRRWDSVLPYEDDHISTGHATGLLSADEHKAVEEGRALLDPYLAGLYRDQSRPARLIHGDLHDENVKSFRRRLSVFDFEDLLIGHPEHDLAVALYGPYYNNPDLTEVVGAMRAGYEEVGPWPVESIDDLRPLFAARALGLVNFCLTLGAEYQGYISMLTDRVADFVYESRGAI